MNYLKSRCVNTLWAVLYATIINFLPFPAFSAAQLTLEHNSLPAKGRQETVLTVPAFGRYSLLSKSEQGTALRYINKMSGPSGQSGSVGEQDGRIDAFLDIGEYKILTYADENGSGNVKLEAVAYTEINGEINGEIAPELIEHKLVSAQLGDFQQRSYWINIKSRQTLLLEAAGRSLGDLRLWHDGNWLLNINPSLQTIEPEPGKPLSVRRISADLNPGLYLLVAYGGEALPWAETSIDQPFHLRMGIPEIAGSGVDHLVTSPFGYDRWLVPATADYFRLELQKNSPASINVENFSDSYSFTRSGRRSEITKESRLPVAELRSNRGSKDRKKVVTISATAGQDYIFQRFSAVQRHTISDPGNYWVTTLHSGYGEDSADATSILTDLYRKEKYVDSRAIELSRTTGWQRRFNMLDTLTMYFEVKQQGTYRVEADGISGEFRFEPFTTFRARNYKTPRLRDLGSKWSLDRGFYVLTVVPEHDAVGVTTLSVYADGNKPVENSNAQVSSRYKSVNVEYKHRYTVYLNQQPGVTSGILVRKYPIDLSDSMPLTLNPNENLFLSVKIPAKGELVAKSADGSLLPMRLKKPSSSGFLTPKQGSNRYAVGPGRYDLAIHNQGETSQNYQLQFTDASQLESTALPAFDLNLVRRPDFPELTTEQAQYLDLGKRQWSAFNVIVNEPGLYKLESTGLLQTRGNIRTRVITQLDQQSANGIGRNFLIQQYLREGDYQLALTPEGDTFGHLGVELNRTNLINGGHIENGIAARYSLPSGEGLQYRFEIKKAGQYKLQSFGTNGYFKARLEDGDGWPLVRPGIDSNLELDLHEGNYRLVVLPTELPARVLTLLQRVEKAEEREGHGPFVMDLNPDTYSHTWLEPAEGEDRQPDIWTFELPAQAETSLTLSEGMEATLIGINGETLPLKFSHLKPFKQNLAAGKYRVEARASRKNNRLDYSLTLGLKELLVGQQRAVTAPVEIDIATGQASLIEINSFGRDDVRAELFSEAGKLLARNDDRENDWNFDIIQSLPEGRYRLLVTPVGKTSAHTSIRLSEPKALAEQVLQLPAELSLSNPLIHSYRLDLSAQTGVIAIAAESRDSVSLTLEKRHSKGEINGAWYDIANSAGSNALLLAAIDNQGDAGHHYRLKVWSPEQRGAEIRLGAALLNTAKSTEASVTRGLKLDSKKLLSHDLVAASVELNSPGMFKVPPQIDKSLFWIGEKNGQLQAYDGFISSADNIWLVSLKASQPLQAARVLLKNETLQFNVGASTPAWIDTVASANGYDLVVAESRIGLPGVGVLDDNKLDARTMGVGFGSSMALSTASPGTGKFRIKVWDSGNGKSQLPIRLKRYQFKKATRQILKAGIHDASLGGEAALSFGLNGKLQDLRFNLPQGVAAVLLKKDKILQSFWPDRSDQNYQIWTDADTLLTLNTRSDNRVFNIQLNTATRAASLSQQTLFKHYFPESGNFSLIADSANSQDSFIGVHGEHAQLQSQNRQGQVFRGKQLPITESSMVNLSHGVGLVTVWLNHKADFNGNISGSNQLLPAQIKLNGQQQSFVFERDSAGFISLRAATPLIARIRRNGLPDQIRVYAGGLKTSLFLPQGKNQLKLESTTNQDLNGLLNIAELKQVELKEGLGRQVSLLPGDARIYRFSMPESQDVGIGVQASVDVALAYLFNQRGELLGEGVTQQHRLSEGSYYLMVELPAQPGSGVEIRPAIVGLESRDTGPSKDIMLDYQQYSLPEAL